MSGDIWIWAEQNGGEVPEVVMELLGKGRELADELGVGLAAVLLTAREGEKAAGELFNHGADRVFLLEHERLDLYQNEEYTDLLSRLIEEKKPEVFLMGGTPNGMELAARVAARVRTGLTAHCVDLYMEEKEGKKQLAQVVPGFGDNIMVKIVTPEKRPQMATVRPGVMPVPESVEKQGEIEKISVDIREEAKNRTLEIKEVDSEGIPLEEAEIVVAAGWGLNSCGGCEQAFALAEKLNGAAGCTRPIVDKGWMAEDTMIGQSGKTVKPKLLVTLGVSGAMHFTTGITGADKILAVDQNPEAPIFKTCDVGIVGDLRQVLPQLIEEADKLLS